MKSEKLRLLHREKKNTRPTGLFPLPAIEARQSRQSMSVPNGSSRSQTVIPGPGVPIPSRCTCSASELLLRRLPCCFARELRITEKPSGGRLSTFMQCPAGLSRTERGWTLSKIITRG